IVVVGDGDIEYFSSEDNHHTVNALPYVLTRRFEVERTAPISVIEDGDSVCKLARPTFSWRIDGDDKWASAFGTTYTAFKVKVWNEGGDLVYDSGYQRMPAADSKGVYNWTAPLYVDSSSSSGSHQVFSNLCNYTWQVFTYNSKFKTDEAGSQKRTFRMNVTEIDQSSYSLAVNVAYAGPGKNLAGAIRVQAFTSPDFSGYPECEAFVTDVTSKALDASAGSKVVLKGLKPGKYFLRAYIDTDADFVLDDWESWGYLSERDYAAVVGTKNIFNLVPVTIGAEIHDLQVRQLFIEDADTDGDGFPDIWEAEQNGGEFDPEVVVPVTGDAELIAVNPNLLSHLDKATQGFIATTVQALSTPSGLSMISGVPLAVAKAVFSSGTVPAKVVDDSVNITSMSIDTDSREVVLGVSAETAADKFDSTIASLYALKVPNGATVTVKVYRTPNLAEDWTLASTQTVVISLAGTEIRAPLADDVDLKSGFFKVEVE
ncbi:MAG: hypothetical protein J6W10_03170, partial [Kiritimatiellae bacterium]|nr:hypothetical protein [Kiritimatiellia bacterium]